MKNCPLNVEEDSCDMCHWQFGPDTCGIFSIAEDLSIISEESLKQTKLLEAIFEAVKIDNLGER